MLPQRRARALSQVTTYTLCTSFLYDQVVPDDRNESILLTYASSHIADFRVCISDSRILFPTPSDRILLNPITRTPYLFSPPSFNFTIYKILTTATSVHET